MQGREKIRLLAEVGKRVSGKGKRGKKKPFPLTFSPSCKTILARGVLCSNPKSVVRKKWLESLEMRTFISYFLTSQLGLLYLYLLILKIVDLETSCLVNNTFGNERISF